MKCKIIDVIQLLINKVIYYLLYLSTILIKLISQFKRNDSKYILKSNTNKVYILMKKHGDKIVQEKMIEKHERIKDYLLVCSATAMNAELTV